MPTLTFKSSSIDSTVAALYAWVLDAVKALDGNADIKWQGL